MSEDNIGNASKTGNQKPTHRLMDQSVEYDLFARWQPEINRLILSRRVDNVIYRSYSHPRKNEKTNNDA